MLVLKVGMTYHLYLLSVFVGWHQGDMGKTHPSLQIVILRPSKILLCVAAAPSVYSYACFWLCPFSALYLCPGLHVLQLRRRLFSLAVALLPSFLSEGSGHDTI